MKFKVGDRVRIRRGHEEHFTRLDGGTGTIFRISPLALVSGIWRIHVRFPNVCGGGGLVDQVASEEHLEYADNGIRRAIGRLK